MNTFAALAVPTRLHIIEVLAKNGRMNASAIGKHFSISAPAISQHLRVLTDAHVVTVVRHGRQRIYSMNPKALSEIEAWVQQQIREWDARLDNLESYLQTLS